MLKNRSLGIAACSLAVAIWANPLTVQAQTASTGPGAPFSLGKEQLRQAGITLYTTQAASPSANSLLLNGTVVVPNQALDVISMPATGIVQSIDINTLDSVKAGQTIARIYSAQLIELEREYLQASSRHQVAAQRQLRDDALYAEGIIPESRAQDSRSQAMQAQVEMTQRAQSLRLIGMSEAALNKLKSSQQLSAQMALSAPAAGSVVTLKASPGQRMEAGEPIATIAREGKRWIELQANRQQAEMVSVGDAITVKGCDAQGRIAAIGGQVNSANQSVLIRADLKTAPACLRPNQFAEVQVQAKGHAINGIAVPAAAVIKHGQQDMVFVSGPKGFVATPIHIVGRDGTQVRVDQGLTPGQQIAVGGLSLLKGAWMGLGREGGSD